MRLKKMIVVGAGVALLLLLCAALIMDRMIAEQQLKSVIATNTATQTNIFVLDQPEAKEPLPSTATDYASLVVEEITVVEPAAKQQTTTQSSTNKSVPTDGFQLKIGNTKISVGYDTSEESLEKHPGWLSTSAYPGEEGICIIYGHRNRKHLRALEKVEIGDEIMIDTEDGMVFAYTICDIYIVDDLSEIVLSSTDEPTMVLVTCYPFRYSGSAPQKYVTIAKQKE